METTPLADRWSRPRGTPGSGRVRSALKTPQSVLTPNDDAAEKASIRRKRRSDALRLSLSDAFASQADRHRRQAQQQQDQSNSKQMLSEEARNALLEQTLKLATENKITDRNAWHLDLITHLPDIIGSGAPRGHSSSSSSSGAYNFQKMSGGLDAGVTIYAKRVELTYKSAMSLGSAPAPKQQGGGDEDGFADDGDENADGLDDAAAAAAKGQKQKGGRARQGGSVDEEATLTTPDHLRAKKGDQTFAVDPLFHTMSALFDEGGAKGLLLLNQSVYEGAHIMTAPHEVPEQAFPLQPPPQHDTLLHLQALQQQLAACSSAAGSSQYAPATAAACDVLTPGLPKLYALLEETCRTMPGHNKQQQQSQQKGSGLDVASIMQEALRNLPPTPMPRLSSTQTAPLAAAAGGAASSAAACAAEPSAADPTAAAAGGGGDDVSMADADAHCSTEAFGDEAMQDGGLEDHMHDYDGGKMQGGGSSSTGVTAAGGAASGGVQVVASFLATCEAAAAEGDDAVAAGGDDYDGGEGYEDDGCGWEQQQQDRRQSLLGLGDEQEHDSCSALDADALQQLLGAAAEGGSSSRAGGTTAGSGWAGSRFWKYRSAAAAAARMAAGSSGGAVKRAAAVGGGSRSKSAHTRLDFSARPAPAELAPKLARGDRRQTCLVTAARTAADKTRGRAGNSSSSAADTLLPEDLHYQPSSLLQLFLRPDAIGSGRQQCYQQQQQSHGGDDGQLPSWAEEGARDGEGEDGYYDDGDGGYAGAEGYNAGDLSVGDPGFSAGGVGDEWWSPDGELLSAPKRMAGRGVSYQRSAKQVDVRALKDLLWDSLVAVNQQKAADTESSDAVASHATAAEGAAVVPFEEVIVHVPEDSAAGALEDVSVHMCFICLLHLANEKGLVVKAHDDLKTLTISNVN